MNASKAESEVMNSKNDLLKRLAIDSTLFEATLSREILKQYLGLIEVITSLPFSFRDFKEIEGIGGNVSISDIIALPKSYSHKKNGKKTILSFSD